MAEAVTTNSSDQSAGPGNIQFDIAAIYVPTAQDNDSTADEGKPGEGKPSEKSGNPQAQPKPPVKASQTPARNPSQALGASPTQAQNGPAKSMPMRPH